MIFCLVFLMSYLVGSFTVGYFYFFWKTKEDIRKFGSGNLGATNLHRLLGKRAAIITFLFDFLKSFLIVFFCQPFFSIAESSFIGLAAVLGHMFPVWLGFKGGKGVSTTLGVFGALNLIVFLVAVAVWGVVFKICRVVSIASILSLVAAISVFIFLCNDLNAIMATSVMVLLVFVKHYGNVVRLFKGKELGFYANKSGE